MAKPGTVPPIFASASVFTSASGLPVGAEALEGTSVRLAPPSDFWTYGLVPGNPLYAQWMDYLLGWETEWTRWVADGTSTMTKTAHLVETDSSGIARLWALRLGDGTATGLNATKKLDVIGDGTQNAVTISTPASGLEALEIACASNFEPAIYVLCTGTQGALECDASGSTNPTAKFTATTQPAVSATSTAGVAVDATATSAAAAVRGTGHVAGVLGIASAAGGTGVVAQSHASATSSGEALVAQAFADATGARCIAADGNAILAQATGDEDAVAILASGDGAPLRLDAQAADPTVQRVGQHWMSEVDTDRAVPRVCTNATGLEPVDSWTHVGPSPLVYGMVSQSAVEIVPEDTTNQILIGLAVDNPYGFTISVEVSAEWTVEANPIGTIPLAGAITTTLHNITAGATIQTDSFDYFGRQRGSMRTTYTLPTGTSTINLRASVAGVAVGPGAMDFANMSLVVRTASGGLS
jgi:hypothetical protein